MPRLAPAFHREIPAGDNRERRVCDHCAFVDYENPRVVVGCVPEHEGKILLCRRSIEPRRGYWTLPAGFMETNETTAEGAAREAEEEALAQVEIGPLLTLFEVPHVSQVHVFYRATLREPRFGAGHETLEARLFTWDEIPWDEIAFESVAHALWAWREGNGLVHRLP